SIIGAMKAAVITRQGAPVAPNVQVVDDWPQPTAGPGQVLIKTEAAALNHLDLWIGRGLPGVDLKYPCISGSDGCGIVESVGQGVDQSWIGKQVVINAAMPVADPTRPQSNPTLPDLRMIGEHEPGTMAQNFVVPAENVLDIGDANAVDAAAFGLTHLTAWRMLWTKARLEPGQSVLITGIGGGVALAALNLARHFGCTTIVTSRHQWKLDEALKLGADHAVLDTGEDFSREVRKLTGKRGVDVCVDSIGRAVHQSCIKSLARGGVFVTCGCTTGPDAVTDLARLFWNQCSIIGSTMGDMNEFGRVVALFTCGAIKPVIDTVYDAAEAANAYERLESGEQFGKVVVRWP
ncbi:MAG: zinc-binding dehydrogenase, partial [Planctomycetota bacterium]|nr:zinc-binding dehydrogenase [Planctomycetota bacterium]